MYLSGVWLGIDLSTTTKKECAQNLLDLLGPISQHNWEMYMIRKGKTKKQKIFSLIMKKMLICALEITRYRRRPRLGVLILTY